MRRLATVLLILATCIPAPSQAARDWCPKWQFSLRTTLLGMAAIGGVTAYFAEQKRRDRLLQEFVRSGSLASSVTATDPKARAQQIRGIAFFRAYKSDEGSVKGVNRLERFTRANPDFQKMAEKSGVNWDNLRERVRRLEKAYGDPGVEDTTHVKRSYVDDTLKLARYYEQLMEYHDKKAINPEQVGDEIKTQMAFGRIERYLEDAKKNGVAVAPGDPGTDEKLAYLAVSTEFNNLTPEQIRRGMIRYEPSAKIFEDDPAKWKELKVYLDTSFRPDRPHYDDEGIIPDIDSLILKSPGKPVYKFGGFLQGVIEQAKLP